MDDGRLMCVGKDSYADLYSTPSGPGDDGENSLSRHDNHRGMCGPVSRTMLVSIVNS